MKKEERRKREWTDGIKQTINRTRVEEDEYNNNGSGNSEKRQTYRKSQIMGAEQEKIKRRGKGGILIGVKKAKEE